ncbi:MAG: hypothetical protein ACLQAT_03805 [Candidatus Binataceae bacterium]
MQSDSLWFCLMNSAEDSEKKNPEPGDEWKPSDDEASGATKWMRPKSSLRLSLYAGLSSLFVTLLYQSIKSFIALPALQKVRTAVTIVLVSIGILIVIEPLLSRIRISPLDGAVSKRREKLLVRMLSLAVIVLVSVSDGLLHEYLGETIRQRGLNGIEQLVFSLVGPSVITFSWLYGLRTAPRKARTYGLYAAILVGLVYFTVPTIFLINQTSKTVPPTPGLTQFGSIEAEVVVSLAFFSWLLTCAVPSGYLGGLAVDRGWCRHAWQRIAIGLAVAASIVPVAIGIMSELLSAYSGRKISGAFAWSFILEPTIGNIGWALGVALVPDADVIFQSDRTRPSGDLSLIRESARVAWAAGLMIVVLVIFSLACMTIPTRLIFMSGSHSMAASSPRARSTSGH